MDLIKMPGVVYCEFKKGESIIRQGEKVDFIYYLLSGTCYRTTITGKGDEIIYGVKESNDFVKSLVGVLILYANGFSVSNFIAKSKCCCYKIPKETFFEYVKDKSEILSQLLYLAMWELRELHALFQSRQEGKVANRLCELLLKNSQNRQDKLVVNKVYSNNAEISRFLGIHKVTVAKILKTLRDEGIIDKQKEGIVILDEKKLVSYAKAEKTIEY